LIRSGICFFLYQLCLKLIGPGIFENCPNESGDFSLFFHIIYPIDYLLII